MSTNYLPQGPSQAWSWETVMDPHHHHHHFQVQQEGDLGGFNEREHMFEKPLTPSDVGKLNRLVIPKQHAEKYFPLAGESGGEKGLLLCFEDESGKTWRFRYSYWTSSQSYVLTKGWSRFVKEKRLDAGDVVLFQRRLGDHLLFIGCRRRGDAHTHTHNQEFPSHTAAAAVAPSAVPVLPWSPTFYATPTPTPSPSRFYVNSVQQDCHPHADGQVGSVGESAAAMTKPVNSKRLRLFGVNLDCGPDL